MADDDVPQAIERRPGPRSMQLVWLVPIAAAIIGGWIALKAYWEQGPTITIQFTTGEGIEAGKTRIKHKAVDIGTVQSVGLSDDRKRVVVTAQIDRKAARGFLVEDTRFWVVRPRIAGGQVSGLVTAPIAKAPLYEAGFKFPGHTEFLAQLTAAAAHEGPRGPNMMLAADDLRVALVTIHEPLAKVPGLLTVEKIVNTGLCAAQALRRDFGIEKPRLAVAGLNPHAGESGSIGREEIDIVAPAVEALKRQGVDVRGPVPADTLFHAEARATYDCALCLHHDQALIPVKMLDFWGGVNVTLGLPIVRTSPDHGTGFDIAGRGLARADSLIAAIRMAAQIAARRAA